MPLFGCQQESLWGTGASGRLQPQTQHPITISVSAGTEVELAMASYTVGLDGSPATDLRSRPASLTTGVHELADSTLVTTVTRLRENATGSSGRLTPRSGSSCRGHDRPP